MQNYPGQPGRRTRRRPSAPSPAAQRQGNTPASRRARPHILAQQRRRAAVVSPQPAPRRVRQQARDQRQNRANRRAYVRHRVAQIRTRNRNDALSRIHAVHLLHEFQRAGVIPRIHRTTPPTGTMLDYRSPLREGRSIVQANRAFARSKVSFDPKSRTLYSSPSDVQVQREYRAALHPRTSTSRKLTALKRLDRWGYEGHNAGNIRVKPLGRVAIPESSLRPDKAAGITVGGGDLPTERLPSEGGLKRYTAGGYKYVKLPSGRYQPAQGHFLRNLSRGLTAALRQRTPNPGGSVGKGPGGVLIASTVPTGGQRKLVPLAKTFGGHVISDAVNTGAQAVPSLYQLAAATYELAHGNDSRAKKLWSDYKKTGVIPALLSGKPGEALQRLGNHPVAGYLELRGGQVALTRTVARGAVHGIRLAAGAAGDAGASRVAADILATRRGENVPGLGFVERRGKSGRAAPYSKDLLIKYAPKVGQKARDARRLRESAAQGRAPSILNRRDVELAAKERVDHAEGVSAVLQRDARDEIHKLTKKFPERYAAVGRLILEGQVRRGRLRQDLEHQLRIHESARPNLTGEKLATNLANTNLIKSALSDKKLLSGEHKAFDTLHEYAAGLNQVERELQGVGYLAPEQVKAKHVGWLTTHEGARPGTRADAVLTDAGRGRVTRREAVRAAGQETSQARTAFVTSERQATRQYGETKVRVEQENRKLMRKDKGVRQASKAYNEAARERQAARKYAHNVERARSVFTDRERAVAQRRLQGAEEQFTEASGALRTAQATVRKQAEDNVIRERGDTVGPYGRSPAGPLGRLEEARGRSALNRELYGRAQVRERAAKAEERTYRGQTRGMKQRRIPWMVDRNGKEITPERIKELADTHGVNLDSIAYISQRGFELSEQGAYYQRGSLTQRPFTSTVKRTGAAARQGVVDLTRDAVLEDAFRQRSKLSAVEANLRMLNSVGAIGLRVDDNGIGGFAVARDAKEAARKLQFDENGAKRDFVPDMETISLAPFYKRRAEIMRVADKAKLTDFEEFAQGLLGDFEKARDIGRGGRAGGPYILVPKVALDRAAQHARNLGPGDFFKGMQVLTHQFRQTVLLTSIRWFAGNVIEMFFRTIATEGIGPRGWYTGRKLLSTAEKIDPKGAAELRAGATGGANFSTIMRYHIHRSADQFESPLAKGVANAFDAVLRPGKKLSPATPWRLYSYLVRNLNRTIERQGQVAALGKVARREWREMTRGQEHSMLVGEKAWNDLARGALKTENQVAFAREVDTIIGKYDRFGPGMRYAMTTYAPFVAWYRNALKFVFATLPGRHPIKTSILASNYAAQQQKLSKQGYDLTMRGGKPSFLQGSLEFGGKNYRIQHYLPFGAIAEYDTIAQLALPQVGFLSQVAGVDFTGKQMRLPNGDTPSPLDNFGAALYSLGESIIPFVAVARRVRESGGSSAPFSTIFSPKSKSAKPDSNIWQGVERTMLNPFYPTASKSSTGGGAAKTPQAQYEQFKQRSSPNSTQQEYEKWKKANAP